MTHPPAPVPVHRPSASQLPPPPPARHCPFLLPVPSGRRAPQLWCSLLCFDDWLGTNLGLYYPIRDTWNLRWVELKFETPTALTRPVLTSSSIADQVCEGGGWGAGGQASGRAHRSQQTAARADGRSTVTAHGHSTPSARLATDLHQCGVVVIDDVVVGITRERPVRSLRKDTASRGERARV